VIAGSDPREAVAPGSAGASWHPPAASAAVSSSAGSATAAGTRRARVIPMTLPVQEISVGERSTPPQPIHRLTPGTGGVPPPAGVAGSAVIAPGRPGTGQPRRRRSSALIAGTTSCRSPITAYVALVTIGASGSVLMARMFLADEQPAQCWIAPLMPHGM
jgi:hypothetical protein